MRALLPDAVHHINMTSRHLGELIKLAAISGSFSFILFRDIFNIRRVEGRSMQPTFNPDIKQHDYVLVDKWTTINKLNLRVGDVVILISPNDPSKSFIKRIAAMPGDTLYLNETGETVDIEQGHCWVEGDNQHAYSYDSNAFGSVPLGLIEGRVRYIIWPPDRVSKVDSTTSPQSIKTVLLHDQH